ncbi:eukaryotic translation initiation factor 3 subunit J-like [Ornithodoros turicata]|uniref:Eukaryotic translation initiation factor 3 subunit J n=1 Tax=Ornithodoros turicata TaxID=34597 RepID=A0A2R5LH66_9ACAR
MADDWEKEDYKPPSFAKKPVTGDRWEGEDEEDVKENWDDEEDAAAEGEKAVATQVKKKKTLSQIIQEKEEKRRKEAELKRVQKEEELQQMTPEEAQAEKLRRQQMQEEADLELAKEAFGLDTNVEGVDSFNPITKEDFDQFRKALCAKLTTLEKSALYIGFIDELLRDISINIEPEDLKRWASTLNAVANEKVKQQKMSKHKKKGKKGGASLNVGKDDSLGVLDDYSNEYDDFM